MITVDCSEMTLDDQLALAAVITERLEGKGVALVKDEKVVVDAVSKTGVSEVASAVKDFVLRRRDAQHYSVESDGDDIIIHSPDPLARSRGRKDSGQWLPDNLYRCPFSGCGFATPYLEVMMVHSRIHGA